MERRSAISLMFSVQSLRGMYHRKMEMRPYLYSQTFTDIKDKDKSWIKSLVQIVQELGLRLDNNEFVFYINSFPYVSQIKEYTLIKFN